MRLQSICQITSGFTTRGRLHEAPVGGRLAIQLRDVRGGCTLSVSELQRYAIEAASNRSIVRGGEILFRSRGVPSTAAVVPELEEPAVALLPLVVLRPDLARVLPEYLAWVINEPAAQRHFDCTARGTNIRMIPKPALEALEVPLPGIETQRRIVETHALARREGALLRELAACREQLTSLLLHERALSASIQPGVPQ